MLPKPQTHHDFKLSKLWVFKHFLDNKELFKALLDCYNKDLSRFELKSVEARKNALKLLDQSGFLQVTIFSTRLEPEERRIIEIAYIFSINFSDSSRDNAGFT